MTATITSINEMSKDQLLAIIAKMQSQSERKLSLKVSTKGAVSLYGMGRFPVTLYGEQWTKLLAAADQITAFLNANRALLSTKA